MQEMCSSVPQKVVMKEENIFVDIEVSELFKIWSDEELRKIQALGKKKKVWPDWASRGTDSPSALFSNLLEVRQNWWNPAGEIHRP